MQQNQYALAQDDQQNRLSILQKTDYKKQKPNLRRHYPEQWGRFLDNHWDPDVHPKPFTIAMKAPDSSYRFYQQLGLTHQFKDARILEKQVVEPKQPIDQSKFVKFEEFSQMEDGEVMVSIEHCVNCASHKMSTNHDENKYKAFAVNLMGAIREKFPHIKVILKPISTNLDEKVTHLKVNMKENKGQPTVINNQVKELRIGAFEVQLCAKIKGRSIEQVVFSKIQTGRWPSITQILAKIHFFQPIIPSVTIQLFRDGYGDDYTQDNEELLKDLEVTLTSNYDGTASQHQLNEFLATSMQEKMTQQMISRHKRLLGQNKSGRPQSAQVDALNFVSLFKQQNQTYQRNFQSYTTLPNVRPISASTYQPSQRSIQHSLVAQSLQVAPGAMQSMARGQRPTSAYTQVSRTTFGGRPMSASTARRNGSTASIRKSGRGQGYFGDDRDVIRVQEQKKATEKAMRVSSENKTSDERGRVIFSQVRFGLYTIQVKGNDTYQTSQQTVTILDEEGKDQVIIYVGVRPRIDKDIEFSFVRQLFDKENNFQTLPNERLEAKAVLIPDQIKGAHSNFDEMELEEYEFNILWDAQKETWVSTLMYGRYLINVRAPGFKELNHFVEISPDQKQFKMDLSPLNNGQYNVIVQAVNAETGDPVKNVFLELFKENNQQSEQGLTDGKGNHLFVIRSVGQQLISARKTGFIPMQKKFNFTQGLINRMDQYVITIPMIKENVRDALAILTYNGRIDNVKLRVLSNDKDEDLRTLMFPCMQVCGFDVDHMLEYNIEESPVKNGDKKKNPSLRFVAHVGQADLLRLDQTHLDRSFKNILQDFNMQFTLVYRDPRAGNQTVIKTLEAPSFLNGESNIWDICMFCAPHVIETNTMVEREPEADKFMSYFLKLAVFFRNRRNHRFNSTLGFDAKGVHRMEDTWIDEMTLVEYMNSLLEDKLWSHDQKKMYQKVQLRKEPEEKLTQIHHELNEFYAMYARSLKNLFGYVSLRKFQEYMERL